MALEKPANQKLRLNSPSVEVRTSRVLFIIITSGGRAEFIKHLNAKYNPEDISVVCVCV